MIAIGAFTFTESASVFANLPPREIRDVAPRPIEHYDISRGLIAYRVTLPAGPAGVLDAAKVRDLAWATIDGRKVGTMDTRQRRFQVDIPARRRAVTLEILVYTIARVNFGVEIHDRKGLHGPVRFLPQGGAAQAVENWTIRAIDFGADGQLPPLAFKRGHAKGPAFWRSSFEVRETGDTFLDMSGWGQGIVWVNGRCLGRYWQTMYLPGPWIRRGRNDVVVLDLTGPRKAGPRQATSAGLKIPLLDQLHPERDLAR